MALHEETAHALAGATFMDLFQRLDQSLLEQIWQNGRAQDALRAIVSDDAAEPRARFLAAEILFVKQTGYPPQGDIENLAAIYASALRDAPAAMANPWGLPGIPDGQIAQHVIRLGEAALPAFIKLLNDESVVTYGGSQEATIGNSYHYRVKDLAAALIAQIRNLPFVPDIEPSERNKAIRKLALALK
ncbi:MAG TPA: hypothetical protein VMV39_07285 [Terracidiphilus sp.]|nr:hypothetical protein [Terracidiphilus sp.]